MEFGIKAPAFGRRGGIKSTKYAANVGKPVGFKGLPFLKLRFVLLVYGPRPYMALLIYRRHAIISRS